ncbi:MAG: hypothetical protein WA445_21220 [Pseudolabrys sp.]
MIKIGRSIPEDSLLDVSTVPVPPEEKSKDELLLELGDLVTLDHLDRAGSRKQAHGQALSGSSKSKQ